MKNLAIHLTGYFKPATAPLSPNSKNRKAFSRRPQVILVILLSVSLLLRSQPLFAQAPQQFSFQGVARDAAGKIVANKNIIIGFDIFQGSSNGPVVFNEVHNTSTNTNGIFTVQIGSIGNLSNINWETNSYFLHTIMYYDGLPTQVDLGTTQLLSVPYSLHALKATDANKSVKSDTAIVAKKWIDDEPIVQTASISSPLLPDVSNENILIWYPKNAAFRVGKNTGNKWNRATIGICSFATGNGTLASGENSASFGEGTEATGNAAFALGDGSKASGTNAFAAGSNANASGIGSTAIGENAAAASAGTFAVGLNSKATEYRSIAIGNAAESSGQDAVALGKQSVASGTNATAFGHANSASGESSTSIGHQAIASGKNAVSLGYRTIAKSFGGQAAGIFNNSSDNPNPISPAQSDRLFQIGNGTSNLDLSNALTILRNGNIGIGNNVLAPEYAMDFGARPRVRHNGATAGIHFNDSQNQVDGFVGMKTDDEIGFYVNNGWRFWVNSQVSYSHGFIVNTSDRRLKTNISPFRYASLLKLNKLTGYHYNWIDPKRDQSKQTGLIAQEVENYFPELVVTGPDGFKAVNYIGLIPHLIEAVKELDKKTEEITALKKELASMQEMNKKLSAVEASVKELLAGQAATSTQTSK